MTSQPPGEITAPLAQRIGWAVLILITLYICYFSHLGVIGFVGPDEPRYAWIARDMAETGDWVTPRLYGKPWFEKPPLLYWGGAIFFRLFPGQPEVAARLTSAICALFATLTLAWLAWLTYGEACARSLLLLLPTSVGMIGFSHAAATDMPFAGILTIAMVCAAVALGLTRRVSGFVLTNLDVRDDNTPILPRTPWLALILFGFFLGLAVLAKGPAAIILSGGAVFFWAIFTKRWRDALRLLHPAAIASFCLTALPWYILCARRNPDFFRIFIIEHNFKRYLTPEFQHIQPFWFYGIVLLVAFLPWTAAVLAAITIGIQRFRQGTHFGPTALYLFSWSLFCLLFFTISRSKLPGYILPAIPALGFLLARACSLPPSKKSSVFRYFSMAGVLLFALGSGVMSVIAAITSHTSYSTSSLASSLCIVLFLYAITNAFLWSAIANSNASSIVPRVVVAVGLVAPLLVAMLSLNRLSAFLVFWDPSAKVVAEEILSHNIPTNNLAVHHMNRGMQYGLSFYVRKEILDWSLTRPTTGYLLSGSRDCTQVVSDAAGCEEPPIYLERSRRFLYRLAPASSLDRLGGRRQPN